MHAPRAAGVRRLRSETDDQNVRPSISSLATSSASDPNAARRSVIVSPDHQLRSFTVAGPWLAR